MTTGAANLTNLQTKFLKMAEIDQQSDNTAPVAQPTDNVAAAPEITDARIESDTLIPPDARTDTASAVLPQYIEIIGDDGNVMASGASDSAPPIVKAALSDRDINAAPEGERSAPEAKPVDRMVNSVENFAFGTNGDNFFNAKEGKQALEELAQLAAMSGPEGLTKLTDYLNDRAAQQYGNQALDASDPKVADKMEGNAVQMEIKNRTPNSMELQFNFLVPNSNEIRSHKFKLDTTPGQAPLPVFDRTTPV